MAHEKSDRSRLREAAQQILLDFHHPDKATQELQNLGFDESRMIYKNLKILRDGAEAAFSDIFETLLESLLVCADPRMALNNFERFTTCGDSGKEDLYRDMVRHPESLFRLVVLFGGSQWLSHFLMSSPKQTLEYLSPASLLRHPREKQDLYRDLSEMVRDAVDPNEAKGVLRRFRKWEYARIVLRDLLKQADLEEITAEISNVADVCLQAAYEICDRDLKKRYGTPLYTDPEGIVRPCRYSVIGMGKLGGCELNYSSDIDLIFVYSSDNGETTEIAGIDLPPSPQRSGPPLTNHEYYVKLSENLVQIIGATTSEGFVFRVDTRLRPEGEKGDLACSLRSYEIYYESWGQTWERAALMKARPVAGDEALGQEFLRTLQPFVYRKYLDFRAIEEIREMKQRINRSVSLKNREMKDVKLGYGGIREIEFFVQALQLLYGGKEPWVRERNTLRSLHRIVQKGLITYDEEARLSKAYHFLRRLEHRIQFLDEQQTQLIPSSPPEIHHLARRMGYPNGPQDQVISALLNDYHFHTRQVRAVYDNLFSEQEEKKSAGEEDLRLILEDIVGEEEGARILSRYPFQDYRKAYRNILLLRDGPAFSHQSPRSKRIFIRIFPDFLREIIRVPDPDLAMNQLESFITAIGARETFYTFFQNNPQAVPPLIQLLGSSEYLSKLLIRHPDLVDIFLDPAQALEKKPRSQLGNELLSQLAQAASFPEKMDALRKFKYTEEIRIGLMDLRKVLTPEEAMLHLSTLADLCVAGALLMAKGELELRFGRPMEKEGVGPEALFGVIAVGKFGSSEITYGSDLDLFFIYSDEGRTTGPQVISNHEYFSQWAGKLVSALTVMTREGSVFKVDTRLRPAGSKGPLAQSLETFRRYMEQESSVWELQAMTRARMAAGDPELGDRFRETCTRILFPPAPRPDLAREIHQMRERMIEEVSKEDASSYDIKVGLGGIVDIEFLAQYFLLSEGGRHPAIRETHTWKVLKKLRQEGLISAKDYTFLKRAYTFLRTLESRLRMVSNLPSHLLPKDEHKIRAIALRMGYNDTPRGRAEKKLLQSYLRIREGVREMFERILNQKGGT